MAYTGHQIPKQSLLHSMQGVAERTENLFVIQKYPHYQSICFSTRWTKEVLNWMKANILTSTQLRRRTSASSRVFRMRDMLSSWWFGFEGYSHNCHKRSVDAWLIGVCPVLISTQRNQHVMNHVFLINGNLFSHSDYSNNHVGFAPIPVLKWRYQFRIPSRILMAKFSLEAVGGRIIRSLTRCHFIPISLGWTTSLDHWKRLLENEVWWDPLGHCWW